MIDKIVKALQDASEQLRAQTAGFGESAKERTYEIIEEWLKIFPKLEIYGLRITSSQLGVAISPSLEVELVGKHADFSQERLQQILDENKGSAAMTTVFTTIKTAYSFHRRMYADLREPLVVKIRIRLSPEIQVIIGDPLVQH